MVLLAARVALLLLLPSLAGAACPINCSNTNMGEYRCANPCPYASCSLADIALQAATSIRGYGGVNPVKLCEINRELNCSANVSTNCKLRSPSISANRARACGSAC